ncbi:AAA family ATPase [Streptomyces sp. NPDC059477]|uniref:AAA family ATPase n=1 Tax=Streptomyces sp. NPDC059477 TaxID=3346847 RepID=UPI003678C939
MLFGRGEELRRFCCLAEAAHRGRGKAVQLGGPPGIGKSALLDALARRYEQSFRLLRVAGHPDESVLPFAAAERLVASVLDCAETLPGPQRLALRITFGLEEGYADPLLVRLGATRMLGAAAARTPLMVLVDDVHQLDTESAGLVSFLSRRIERAPILLVCAGTDEGDGAARRAEAERMTLGPLSEADSLDLLGWLAPSTAPEVKKHLADATGGNPLRLRHALDALTTGQRAGWEPLPEGPSLAGVPRPEHSSAVSVPRPECPPAVGVPSLECPPPRSVPHSEYPPAPSVPRPEYPPPRDIPRPERSPAASVPHSHHSTPASAPNPQYSPPASIPHQEYSPPASDPHPKRPPARVTVAPEAVERALARGDCDRMAELLDDTRTAHEPGRAHHYARLRAVHTLLTRSPAAAAGQFLAAARTSAPYEPDFTADTLNMAVAAARLAGDRRVLEKAHEARDAHLPTAIAEHQASPPDAPDARPLVLGALTGPRTPDARAAEAEADPLRELAFHTRLLERALQDDEPGSIPLAAYRVAGLEAWLGRWDQAMDHVALGLLNAERTRQLVLVGQLRGLLAWLHAALGDVAGCEAEAQACLTRTTTPVTDAARLAAQGAQVFAVLSEGRPEDVPELLPLSPTALGNTVLGSHGSLAVADLIEAACRTSDTSRAVRLLDVWRNRHPQARPAGTEVLLLRCEALLEEDADAMERLFRRVLALAHPSEFEWGRTRLLFGERLRRARRLLAAREELLAAVTAFRSARSPLWTGRAQRELDACAVRPAPALEGWLALTPQERQVLQLARQGLTNRQIAQALYISPRTVGYHLYKAFPKLRIHSRRQIGTVVPAGQGR